MKIAIIHSAYGEDRPSGENVVVGLQSDALHRAGHDVALLTRKTDDERQKPLYPVRAATRVAFGNGASFLEEVQSFDPDIVHVHNLFPNLGWKWLKKVKAPVVSTLHNYRTFCAIGTALLRGQPCALCPEKGSHHAIANRCYRDSALASLPLAIQTRKPFQENPLIAASDGLVILSTAMRETFIPLGLDKKVHRVIPNFVPVNPTSSDTKNGRWIWVGRLTEEKGITDLIKSWPKAHQLDVFGDGPLKQTLLTENRPGVNLRGMASADELRQIMPGYQGMIISSEMPGNSVGLVHLEAMASGLPVIAKMGSSSAQEVAESGHGAIYNSPTDLEMLLSKWSTMPADSRNILERFSATYSEAVWLEELEEFYQLIIAKTHGRESR